MICVATIQNRSTSTSLLLFQFNIVVMFLEVLREGLFCFPVRDLEGICAKLLSLVFLNFQLLSKMLKFIFIEVNMEVIKFCTRKLIKTTHFMPPLKMINMFQGMMLNFSQKTVGLEVSRLLRFLRLIGHSWSPTITNFWGSK